MDAAKDDEIVAVTRAWLEKAVIGLNLCPFARAVHVRNQIRYVVSAAETPEALLADLLAELQTLADADPAEIDTTLVIHPAVLTDFLDYNDFLGVADAAVADLGLVGEIQVASFHPHYQFAGSGPDDIENYTNRSPYPMLHLLREASVERAVEAFPDASEIYERNMDTLRRLGHEGWRRLGIGPRILTVLLALALCSCSRSAEREQVFAGLWMQVQGSGSPAVVLESGLGDSSEPWETLLPRIAPLTQVVAYDRAGLGHSPPGRAPRSSRQIARELHQALREAGIAPPYVLVGHSAGAFHVRVFAGLYPEEVGALVLVDPTPEDFFRRISAVQSPEEHQELRQQMARYVAAASPGRKAEWAQLERNGEEARAAEVPAEAPVILLTSVRLEPGKTPPMQALWRDLHRQWLAGVSQGEHLVTRKSGHYIQVEEPELVAGAIRRAVEQVRKQAPAGAG